MITAGFIGLGLIGGSIAKAFKKNCPGIHITAYNRSPEPLARAVSDGIVDTPVHEVGSEFGDCDIIFLCTPVEHNLTYLSLLKNIIKPGCIITDVGSVKGYIHRMIHDLGMEECFIGGHPMAGSEKTGYQASSDILLENAYYAITPTPLTSDRNLSLYTELVRLTGAIPIITDPDKHDFAVAGISHVPHLIASSLVNLVQDNDTDDQLMRMLAAGGFKDMTRIASSSSDMWSQICATNPDAIVKLLDIYISSLTDIRNEVADGNRTAIADMFIRSKEYRDSINVGARGPMLPRNVIYCSIEDREGALSEITSLLSDNRINIQNIEIVHNREFMDGVLMIEFYDKNAMNAASALLLANNYTLHK